MFEPRYRQLVQEGRDFGVVLIREGREVGDVPEVHDVGTLASLQRIDALPDGRFNVLAVGVSRFRVARLHPPQPYLLADVDLLPDRAPEPVERLLGILAEYLELSGVDPLPDLDSFADGAVWLAGAVLPAESPKRQRLLEDGGVALAEQLLEEEIDRHRRLGPLAPVPIPGFSPN